MKLIYLLSISTLFLFSCKTPTEGTNATDDKEKSSEKVDSMVVETPSAELVFSNIDTYELVIPDTADLRKRWVESNYSLNLLEMYLDENYGIGSSIENPEYDGEDNSYLCAYEQTYDYHIKHIVKDCGVEGGVIERIILPKTDTKIVKIFIETLFYDSWNTWISDTEYSPEDVGCSYEIVQEEENTIIKMYCGC